MLHVSEITQRCCVSGIYEIGWSKKRLDAIKDVAYVAMTASLARDDVSDVSLLQCLG